MLATQPLSSSGTSTPQLDEGPNSVKARPRLPLEMKIEAVSNVSQSTNNVKKFPLALQSMVCEIPILKNNVNTKRQI